MSTDWKQKSLTPVLLLETDPSYKTVDDLLHAIKNDSMLNIAVTGPYGSGKSSVLNTLMRNAPEDARFLDISLATLDADDSIKEPNKSPDSGKEVLNRKIEYSILQQLVYRETLYTLPFSRLKKIRHFSLRTIKNITGYILGLFACLSLVFCPSWLLIDELYSTFNFPTGLQQAIRFIAMIFLLIMLYEVIKHLIQTFGGMRIEHVNVGGNEINMNDEGSIFNRYLDEILYFFQCTDYNVVIIEDLDRFNTADIFLKLRELNHLINKSKIVNRKIRFIYAVKDDMFKDASRSKFFDYITTVIPVITTSNSKDKLREALAELGHDNDVSDENIRDIAFHIDDMRLLYNIANEYHQYSVRLNNDKEHSLDSAKMLAMIALKNYHPHDFSLLHKREGKIYNAISKEAKRLFIKEAIEQKITQREQIFKKKLEAFDKTSHLSATEIRLIYLMRILSHISRNITNIIIDGQNKSFLQVASSEEYFSTIVKEGKLSYHYLNYNSQYSDIHTFKFSEIEKEVNSDFTFDERIKSLSFGREQLLAELKDIEKEKNKVHSFTVKELLMKFNLYEDEYFRSLELSPMEEDFIRNGYITEEYNDYISYFYPGMMSLSDHQLCLDMRLDRNPPYDSQIDECDILLQELPDSAFQYKSILNINLLDYLAQNHVRYNRQYELTIDLLLVKHPIDFLLLYAKNGENAAFVWNSMIETNSDALWLISGMGTEEENTCMHRQWIIYCKKHHISKSQIIWINNHYDDIASCYSLLSDEMQEHFTSSFSYDELTETSPEMLKAVVETQCYVINERNMPIVVKQRNAADDISLLPEVEEKELALKLNLIKPSWDNIKSYFEEKANEVDEYLFNFISDNITEMKECTDDEPYVELFQSLMEIDQWSKKHYECLCELNPFYITISDKIKAQSEDKIITLVSTGAIEGTVDNFKLLNSFSANVTVAFLKQNTSLFNACIDVTDIDAPLALALLSEPSFSQINYEYVIQKLDPTFFVMTPALADNVCSKLSLRYVMCDSEVLYQAIASCTNKNSAVMAASRAIEVLKNNATTTELLSRLGGKYSRLTNLHISETFVDTPSNNFLIKVLKSTGYISSFSPKDGKLKVNTKRNR